MRYFLFLLASFVVCSSGSAYGDPILAVPVAPNNNASDPVLIATIANDETLTSMPTIPGSPISDLNNPITTAFNTAGELFVGNRHSGQFGAEGTISRFFFDEDGNYISNGIITGNGLSNVHGLEFSPTGELFAVSYRGDQIARFNFDPLGNAAANGTISIPVPTASDHANLGIAFSPDGELFASVYDSLPTATSTIYRWLFDETGAAIPNGSFTLPTTGAHFLEFNAAGELFVPDNSAEVIYRYLFDETGAPIANGTIDVGIGALGIAFAPDGEMWVSHQSSVGILRFLFDEAGNAIPNVQEYAGTSLGQISIHPTQAVPEASVLVLLASAAGLAIIVKRRRNSHAGIDAKIPKVG